MNRCLPNIAATDALLNVLQGIAVPQTIEANKPPWAGGAEGGLLQKLTVFAVELELVAHILHHREKLLLCCRNSDGSINVSSDGSTECCSTLLFGFPFGVVLLPAFGFLDDGQAGFMAQSVRYCSHLLFVFQHTVKFLAVFQRNGVHNEVVMIAIRVAVGGNNHLKAVAPQLLCQRNAQVMSLRSRDLSGLEGLDSMIAGATAQLSPPFLSQHKLL